MRWVATQHGMQSAEQVLPKPGRATVARGGRRAQAWLANIWKNDMKGYPGISRDNPTWCLSRDNPG